MAGQLRDILTMWPFHKKKPKIDEEAETFRKRYETVESFAKIGDYVEYLGVKMLVVGYHDWNPYYYNRPSLRVEWMSTSLCLQKISILDTELSLCKRISTPDKENIHGSPEQT